MRIGFFGGTFDPPHIGHLAVARAARDRFALERVLLAPTGRQPLKALGPRTSFEQRLDMVRLLCVDEPGLEASAVDAPHADGSANYTVDVLRQLTRNDDEVFCIVGADSFLDLHRWRDPDELLRLAEWIIVSRPGFSLEQKDMPTLSREPRARVHVLQDVQVDVSATQLRAALAKSDDDVSGIPEKVLRYIREHRLYRMEKDDERQ